LAPADLLDYLSGKLPTFMMPRYVEIIDQLPRTANGKIRKERLREQGITSSTFDSLRTGRHE
jgi:crotonobetaine/carnitine-CoA ligase